MLHLVSRCTRALQAQITSIAEHPAGHLPIVAVLHIDVQQKLTRRSGHARHQIGTALFHPGMAAFHDLGLFHLKAQEDAGNIQGDTLEQVFGYQTFFLYDLPS